MADNNQGVPQDSLFLPNGLSFLRLALAPLVLLPFLGMPVHPATGPAFALFIVGMSASDVVDGWIARRRNLCTRLGRMLDPLADTALISFLAVGLFLAGAIPDSLLWLLIVRYPLLLFGVLVLYFARGPMPLRPTIFGKATTFTISVVLLVIAVKLLVATARPPISWIEWSVFGLHFLTGANIVYLLYRGVTWTGSRETANNAPSG